MEKVNGIWEGEYTYNHGTETDPDVEYFTFRMEIFDYNGIISGNCEDINPQFGKAFISGFIEGSFISLIKKYERLDDTNQVLESNGNIDPKKQEVHYSGSFDPVQNAFIGEWEIPVSEERISFADDFKIGFMIGTWYMKKIKSL